MGLIVCGFDVGPPGGYPPFRCKNPLEVPTPNPWRRCRFHIWLFSLIP
jgi:hypothetical protein